MQWLFVVAGLLAVVAELHSGTFYLAAVAAAAFLTAFAGFWITGDWLFYTFAALCVVLVVPVGLLRRRKGRSTDLADFDIGQTVSVVSITQPGNRLTVMYRGAQWDARMRDGSGAEPGDTAVIAGKSDKLLHLVAQH